MGMEWKKPVRGLGASLGEAVIVYIRTNSQMSLKKYDPPCQVHVTELIIVCYKIIYKINNIN